MNVRLEFVTENIIMRKPVFNTYRQIVYVAMIERQAICIGI